MSILLAKSLKIDAEQFFGIIIPYMSFILELNFFGLNYGIVCPENVDVWQPFAVKRPFFQRE